MNRPAAAAVPTQVQPPAPPPESKPSPPPMTAANQEEAIQSIVNDPAVKKAMEAFGARIVHVEPRRQ